MKDWRSLWSTGSPSSLLTLTSANCSLDLHLALIKTRGSIMTAALPFGCARLLRTQKTRSVAGLISCRRNILRWKAYRTVLCKVNTNMQKSVAICSDHINKLLPSRILQPRDAPPGATYQPVFHRMVSSYVTMRIGADQECSFGWRDGH